MNGRNLLCWGVFLGGFAVLLLVGNAQPITFDEDENNAWSRFWRAVGNSPLAGAAEADLAMERPPPADPPEPITRANAEDTIRSSGCARHADLLGPALRRSIRVSAVPLDSLKDLETGASRLFVEPDLPPDLAWPAYQGTPMAPVAQINLADVAAFDEEQRMPKRGWLYFFHATEASPTITGHDPAHRPAWKAIHADVDVNLLKRAKWPDGLARSQPRCRVRFWKEWTLPSLSEEPQVLRGDDRASFYYRDLRDALTCRPEREPGWHHLLGHANNVSGPMRPICALTAQGRAYTYDTDLKSESAQALTAGADQWTLLLQVDLDGLGMADIPPEEMPLMVFYGHDSSDSLFFWIRNDDLARADFSNVWCIRQGYFYDEDEYEDEFDEKESSDEEPTEPIRGLDG